MSAQLATAKYQNHYAVLGLEQTADSEAIWRAYQKLEARYSPRNSETRDHAKHAAVTLAYEVLSDAIARRAFDATIPKPAAESALVFGGAEFFDSLKSESAHRMAVLCVLYDRRRQSPATPSMPLRMLEQMLAFPGEPLLFSLWYLKQRDLVLMDDQSSLQITATGMDYLEQNQPSPEMVLSLLSEQALPPVSTKRR
jgi:hypothetical protein